MVGLLLKQEIESTFHVVRERSTKEELVFVCPECGDHSGNRSVNLRTGKTFCWRCSKGQNNKGNFIAWARSLGYEFLKQDGAMGIPLDTLLEQDSEPQSVVPVVKEVALPKGFTPIKRTPKNYYTKLITAMARRKNLDYCDFAEANVGYTMEDCRWEPYAIFPVYDYGKCVYYQGRTYIDVPGETTKRFPSRSQVQWGAGYWVYNIDTVRQQKPDIVVVVESILNVLSLRWRLRELGWHSVVPVCVFKHHISRVQVLKLLQCSRVKEFCLLFDHDATNSAWRTVGALGNKVAVTVAEMPELSHNQKCDPNDDVDAAIRAIEKRTVYTAANTSDNLLRAATRVQRIINREIGS